jgi:predicted transcriptional regulator
LNKGRQKRAWVDIIADMLTIAKDGENITDIMYRTRLSYSHLKEYIELLTANGLLQYDKKSKLYTTTRKGVEYLVMYKRVKSFVVVK